MSDEELRAFVDDFVSGWVFTDRHVRDPNVLASVFMPLVFGALADWSDTGRNRIGLIWEYMSKAGPMCVNGYPTFFSMRLMNVEDWAIVQKAAQREFERRKNIEL